MPEKLHAALSAAGLNTDQLQLLVGEGAETVYYLPTSGALAFKQWQDLRQQVAETGFWPVIIGEEEDMATMRDGDWTLDPVSRQFRRTGIIRRQITVAEIIERAAGLDAIQILVRTIDDVVPDRGAWPTDEAGPACILTTWDGPNKRFHDLVYLALVPTTVSWHVPAYLDFWAANYELAPEDHCAVLKRWEKLYGAEIVALTSSTIIETVVANPPQEREAALSLALEQFSYCPDIIRQGLKTQDALAASLLDASSWFFWWD